MGVLDGSVDSVVESFIRGGIEWLDKVMERSQRDRAWDDL